MKEAFPVLPVTKVVDAAPEPVEVLPGPEEPVPPSDGGKVVLSAPVSVVTVPPVVSAMTHSHYNLATTLNLGLCTYL